MEVQVLQVTSSLFDVNCIFNILTLIYPLLDRKYYFHMFEETHTSPQGIGANKYYSVNIKLNKIKRHKRIQFSAHVRLSSQLYYTLSLKNLQHRSIQNGEVSEAREAPAMVGDNGFYLLMTSVLRSMGPGPMCTTNCYCPVQCNPFVCPSREPICVSLD